MNKFIITCSFAFCLSTAQAGDVTCESSMMHPQLQISAQSNAKAKAQEPATLEARVSTQPAAEITEPELSDEETDNQTVAKPGANKDNKKDSSLGGMFDILLPAKLRNPVE